MTTPEEAVRKYLKGIGAIPKEDPPQINVERVTERQWWIAADHFVRELRRRGFHVEITTVPFRGVAVDFYDPSLRSKLVEKGMTSRVYPDGFIAKEYATVATRGSIMFQGSKVEGDIPVSMIRPDIPEVRFLRAIIREEKPADITEVHLHMWDHRPTVHIHIEGENVDPQKLVNFVCRIRDISIHFITERR